jgi:hypothetical protein
MMNLDIIALVQVLEYADGSLRQGSDSKTFNPKIHRKHLGRIYFQEDAEPDLKQVQVCLPSQ